MKLRKLTWVMLLVIMALVLVACDSGGDDDGDSGDSADSGDSGGVELVETYSGEDGLSFQMPAGWVAESEFGQVTAASSQSILDTMEDPEATTLGDGNIAVIVAPLPADMLGALELDDTASAADILTVFSSSTEEGVPDFSDPEAIELNGKDAAIASGSQTINDTTIDSTSIVVALDGAFVLFNFVADEGGLADQDAVIRAIAGSAEYAAPEGDAGAEG